MLPASAMGYSSEHRTAADNETVRNVYVIGPEKKIKLQIAYPMNTGRNFDEILRAIDSLQLTAKHRVATPANWRQGEEVIIAGSVSVAQLEGESASETAQLRTKGFHDKIATYPGIELVASINAHWSTPGAVDATEAILQAHPDVNLIFASSDLMAVGAATVLGRAKRLDVIVIGFDGIAEGTDLVIAGTAAGDVAQNAKAMGEISVEIAMQIIKGEKKAADFPKVIDSGMLLVHRWNVQKYRADFLGIK